MIKSLVNKIKSQEKELKLAVFYFFIWKIGVLILSIVAVSRILHDYRSWLIWWDQGHYIAIAKNFYANRGFAFFPLLPLLIRFFNLIFHNYVISGQFISSISLLAAIIYLYRLVRIDFSAKISLRSVIYILIFPFSFFFGLIYTESLFLALVTASFYYARKEKWFKASLLAGLASATRVMGIFVFIGILYEYLESKGWNFRRLGKELIYILLIAPSGLISYMLYLQIKFNDFLAFFHSQADWGKSATFNLLIPLKRSLYPIKNVLNFSLDKEVYINNFVEVFCLLAAICLIILAFRKIRTSYLIYAFLSIMLPPLTGILSSVNRYVIILFPIFIFLAIFGENKYIDKTITFIFLIFFGFYLSLFVNLRFWVG